VVWSLSCYGLTMGILDWFRSKSAPTRGPLDAWLRECGLEGLTETELVLSRG
jgi:hypothetical protein